MTRWKSECEGCPAPQLLTAIVQFNTGRYFECHETLEELWLMEPGAFRGFYQGLLQLAVALYHLQRGNETGARSLLQKGSLLLQHLPAVCQEIDLATLLADMDLVRRQLDDANRPRPLQWPDFSWPLIRLRPPESPH